MRHERNNEVLRRHRNATSHMTAAGEGSRGRVTFLLLKSLFSDAFIPNRQGPSPGCIRFHGLGGGGIITECQIFCGAIKGTA